MAGGDRSGADGRLVAALASGATIAEAAAQARVSEATVYRRRRDAAFLAAVAAARADMIERATAMLGDTSAEAVATLRALLAPPTREATRLGAARAILELGQRWREAGEIVARVEALEQALAATTPRGLGRR